jgi:hypothetical protein
MRAKKVQQLWAQDRTSSVPHSASSGPLDRTACKLIQARFSCSIAHTRKLGPMSDEAHKESDSEMACLGSTSAENPGCPLRKNVVPRTMKTQLCAELCNVQSQVDLRDYVTRLSLGAQRSDRLQTPQNAMLLCFGARRKTSIASATGVPRRHDQAYWRRFGALGPVYSMRLCE